MIVEASLQNKEINQLTEQEMMFVHLSTSYGPIILKRYMLRSTLSFIHQNISHAVNYQYSKQLIPYIGLCAMLEQLGTCYNRKDKKLPRFENNLKRALVNFGNLEEDDELIDVIYALRNGLLHNASLTTYDKRKTKYYHFRYNSEIETIYQKSRFEWDGNYETLDGKVTDYTSSVNVEKLKDFVFSCVQLADDLNQDSLLELRLRGGIKQLYFDYVRAVKIK